MDKATYLKMSKADQKNHDAEMRYEFDHDL